MSYTLDDLNNLLNQQARLTQQYTLTQTSLNELEANIQAKGFNTNAEFLEYERLNQQLNTIQDNLAELKYQINEARIDTRTYVPVGNPTQTSNPVNPAVSPAAAQADTTTEEPGFFGRLFGSSETDDDVSEFAEYGSDLSTPPPEPQPTPEPEPQEPVDLNLFAEGSDVTVTEESTIIRDPEALQRIETAIVGTAEPTFQDDVATGFGSFAEDEDSIGLDVAGGSITSIPPRVNDTQAQQQRIVPIVEDTAANEDIITEQEQQAQINQAALDRLRKQSAVNQIRDNEGAGDWRVKLRLARGADYLYRSGESTSILKPLLATDGIVFPYTPSIQILYAADYNQYHPTHSNYQHYFYKGSKVGEVVMTATFTAQDTEEANYLLAVIHFLKSASKMFYGQDEERGSPPPLLFLSGLGDFQFKEAPCVISQFNYVLPNDVDYIRANVQNIRAGTPLQYNLRNKNNGSAINTWSSSINRLLTTPGLDGFFGQKNTNSTIPSQTASLNSDNATYVPTKIEMTITLLPVQNRLQVSEQFSLKEYANGNLITKGFW